MRGLSLCLSLFLIATTATIAQAEVYKWTDSKGQVHYGAKPPANIRADEVKVRSAPSSARKAATEADGKIGQDAAQPETKDKEQSAKAEDEKRKAALKKNCEIARKNLEVLQDPSNRRFRTEDGEVTYFDDEQRQSRIDEAQKYLDEYCKD